MKKIIFILILCINILGFAEKVTTDGKNNLDKLRGRWDSLQAEIVYKNNKWYYKDDSPWIESENPVTIEIKVLKDGILVVPNLYKYYDTQASDYKIKDKNLYFAWDTKYKTLVVLDKNLNITSKEQKIVPCIRNKTCG